MTSNRVATTHSNEPSARSELFKAGDSIGGHGHLNEAPRDIWDQIEWLRDRIDDLVAITPNWVPVFGTRWDVITPTMLIQCDTYDDVVLGSSYVSPFEAVREAIQTVKARDGAKGP